MKITSRACYFWGLGLGLSLFLFGLGLSPLFAAPNLEWGNDLFSSNNRDRYLTNTIHYQYPLSDTSSIGLHNMMYSPDNIRTKEVLPDDHPYSGYTFLNYIKTNKNRIFEYRLGALGHASGTDDLQTWIHKDLGFGPTPMGWDTQEKSEMAAEILYSHKHNSVIDSWIGYTTSEQRYGIRAGNVINSAFLDQQINKEFFCYITLLAGMRGEIIGYNRHLEGSIFGGRKDLYTVNPEPFVATARVGVEIQIESYVLGVTYFLQTPTFTAQNTNHGYSVISFKGDF